MLEIHYGGREFLGRPRDMSMPFGLFVGRGGFQGWSGMSSRRREALARAAVHGEHDTRVLLGSRVVTVDGYALERGDMELETLSDHVNGMGGDGDSDTLTVTHLFAPRRTEARVLIAECVPAGSSHGIRRADFQVQWVCPDPRKYGDELVYPPTGNGTAISVSHYGNFPAAPVVEIANAPSAYTITSPAGTYAVSGAVAGGVHRVDLGTGRVTRNDVLMPGVGHGPLWAVPAGQQWLHTLSVPGLIWITDTFI